MRNFKMLYTVRKHMYIIQWYIVEYGENLIL
jgi:hypothetical protein